LEDITCPYSQNSTTSNTLIFNSHITGLLKQKNFPPYKILHELLPSYSWEMMISHVLMP
jgi:hypothetical protein